MSSGPAFKQARSVARLAAVLALNQWEASGAGAEAVIREFTEHRFDRDVPDEAEEHATLAAADEDFFADLVRGVVANQKEIDAAIARRLATGWRLERIDATVRAMLRAGRLRSAG
jgi:N utilization substance protein B